MADDTEPSVQIDRTGLHTFRATNVRGGTLDLGDGESRDFSPVELLLTAIAGCAALDVEYIAGRRAEPNSFRVRPRADKIRDEHGNRLTGIRVRFEIEFPEGAAGDSARAVVPDALRKSHDRLCTVTRTVELGTAVELELA